MSEERWEKWGQSIAHMRAVANHIGTALLLISVAVAVSLAGFLLHVNLSSAGFIELLLVLLIALRFGFAYSTVVSLAAFLSLNFLFTAPFFTFTVTDPQNWVSLFTFEATALLVSGLSSKVRVQAAQTEEQRARAVKLFELSRAVLLIDQRRSTSDQLSSLVREIIHVDDVQYWIVSEKVDTTIETATPNRNREASETYLSGKDSDDMENRCSRRVMRLGTQAIGGVTLSGWSVDPLAASAIASISAIAFERAHAIQSENRAEVERDAERLRAAVLDGLAHGFKTPLTAIQTASSGLLAIDHLSATQTELVSIIDERATMLSQLTSRLLQTAALESKQIRLRRRYVSILSLLDEVVQVQEEHNRVRIAIVSPAQLQSDHIDASMIELALQQLVDNAAKYSAIGSPISLIVEQSETETRITVENATLDGSSIHPGERAKIFDRFYRGANTAHGPSGSGLGLSIVKKIAEAHGGRVRVESSEDTTRFSLSIPRTEKEEHG